MGKEENNGGKNFTGYDDRFSTYMYNKETGEVFGRTGKRWAQLTIFYTIFYIGLAAFAGLCYFLFSTTLVAERPKWILADSLIGTNPGMGYRPAPDPDKNADSTLIWYERGKKSSDAVFWYGQLTEYIDNVRNSASLKDVIDCHDGSKRATKDKSCRIEVTNFGEACSSAQKFGYDKGDPCILLKLNKILGWVPDCFGIDSDGKYDLRLLREELGDQVNNIGMPATLRDYILRTVLNTPESQRTNVLNTIWVSCEGEGKSDQETVGNFAYHGIDKLQGISGKYFPFYKQSNYQSPFMFVQLRSPQPGVLMNVECKAWARNIIHDRFNRLGSVHFEVLIDIVD